MQNKINNQYKNNFYRPELDGLRAFSITAVIINHFNKEILPSGYLGIDIFFVISGYVITASLFNKHNTTFKIFLINFFERRIKRLFPALLIFVLIASIAICLFNPEPVDSLRTGIASLFGLSNIYLFKQTIDYFSPYADLNIFTHTWSLAVEEQFYILFPFIFWLSGCGKNTKNCLRNLFIIIGTLMVSSIIFFIYLYPINQPAAYFLIPSRLWEISTGSILFVVLQKYKSINLYFKNTQPLFILALMICVMFFPTSWARASIITMVILTANLLISLNKNTLAFKIFTNPKVVYIGLISYSLYLWHWGVLTLSRWTIGIQWWTIPLQIILILVLSICSYNFIEKPLRKKVWGSKRWGTFIRGGAISLLLGIGLFIFDQPLKGKLFLGRKYVKRVIPYVTGPDCLFNLKKANCYFINNNSKRTFWILGDSHAGSLTLAAEKIANLQKMNLKLFKAGGTPFPPIGHYRKTNKEKDLMRLEDFKKVEKELYRTMSYGDVILISLRLPYHFGGTYYEYPSSDFVFIREDGEFGSQREYFDDWIESVNNLANFARRKKSIVIIHTPTPEWEEEKNKSCSLSGLQWFNKWKPRNCKIDSTFFTDENKGKFKHIFYEIQKLAKSNANIHLLDAYSILCPGKICKYGEKGFDFYRGDDHISYEAAIKLLSPQITDIINKNAIGN